MRSASDGAFDPDQERGAAARRSRETGCGCKESRNRAGLEADDVGSGHDTALAVGMAAETSTRICRIEKTTLASPYRLTRPRRMLPCSMNRPMIATDETNPGLRD